MFSFGFFYAGNRGRTGTEYYLRRILSPVRLPIPPLRHMKATSRFELEDKGFAVLCLTTWLCRHLADIYKL